MQAFQELFSNRILFVGICGWFTAQCFKVIITFIIHRRFSFERFFGSGGMPSAHSSFFCAVTMAVGFQEGFDTAIFALSACFAFIVMYDAAGVRRAAGNQAAVLNRILDGMLHNGEGLTEERLQELIGHTPIQVIAGALLGIAIGVIMG